MGEQLPRGQIQRAVLQVQQERIRVEFPVLLQSQPLQKAEGAPDPADGLRPAQPVRYFLPVLHLLHVVAAGQAANVCRQVPKSFHGGHPDGSVGFLLPALSVPVEPAAQLGHKLPVIPQQGMKTVGVAGVR